MIFVDRTQVAEPAILTRPFPDGKTETERAMAFYDDGWDGKSTFAFARYKDDEVKAALESLFRGKCAYCESRFGHVSPEDIEHWRPKGAVVLQHGDLRKPAYYWLAASWTNLFPCCIDCNRRRRQIDVRDPGHLQSGKENLFPVADEQHRWTRPDQADQNGEEPLLLDPCTDDPAAFFAVTEDAVVQQGAPDGTRESRRAQASIEVFGLNRSKLVDERREHRDRLFALLQDARLYIRQLKSLPPGELRDETRGALLSKLSMIKREREPGSPYLLMKVPLIDKFTRSAAADIRALGIGT